MKKYIIMIFLAFMSISVYATSSSISFSRIQQSRLNTIIKQIKLAPGDYKLIVTSTGSKLDVFIPTEPQVITKEIEVIKEVPVEKIVEKIVEKPLSMCVDLSKVVPYSGRVSGSQEKLMNEYYTQLEKNRFYGCSCEYMPKGIVRSCG